MSIHYTNTLLLKNVVTNFVDHRICSFNRQNKKNMLFYASYETLALVAALMSQTVISVKLLTLVTQWNCSLQVLDDYLKPKKQYRLRFLALRKSIPLLLL